MDNATPTIEACFALLRRGDRELFSCLEGLVVVGQGPGKAKRECRATPRTR